MTACAIETAPEGGAVRRPGFTIAADGSYAARLAGEGEARFPERWTLDGPEPYAVPLPADQPEEPGTEVLPLADGRVLIHRQAAGRHLFSLLYPTGPATGQLPLGSIEFGPERGTLTLLPPAPGGSRAYALAVGPHTTALWLVAGGAFGPEHVAEVPGRCAGGVWLDRTGRMLALDRASPDGDVVKSVAVDLERGGEVTPLLQIAERSDDRLLLADPDSGLLLIRSDAPGEDRLGWGVLGSTRPVRFPDSLRVGDCTLTPFAAQPGQVLTPESCAVAVRIDRAPTAGGPAHGSWVGVWRPSDRRLHQLAAPEGWLPGTGLWTREGVLRLPFATREVPCGVAEVCVPADGEPAAGDGAAPERVADGGPRSDAVPDAGVPALDGGRPAPPAARDSGTAPGGTAPAGPTAPAGGDSVGPDPVGPDGSLPRKPVPLQQAPLHRTSLTGRLHRIGPRATRPGPEAATPAASPARPPMRTAAPVPPAGPAATPSVPSGVPPLSVPVSAHAAAPAMVRMTVPVVVPVPGAGAAGGT
ncbi:hypothetical protein [Streptomyces candidus]|uniref:Uncharacterized protein n=1 Tax=Streptomyces candidus TaxID=67283 RepID=A0A7X0HAF5_9ACTN|nr:hypothetical protein [Streptomyces candidus]MBB6433925.1 hypothetical protein [Streptomyces candidus]GHH34010.1 hypothetical protein GCM10018773_05490 [Streptomyces candidus]